MSSWQQIGSGYQSIVAAAHTVFGDNADNQSLYQFDGQGWVEVGGLGIYAGSDEGFVAVTGSDHSVQQFNGIGQGWTKIGGTMASIALGGDVATTLFGIDPQGVIQQYSGTPMQWTAIGSGLDPAKLAANDDRLCAITDGGNVLEYGGAPGQWLTIGTGFQDLILADNALYAIDGAGNIQRYSGTPGSWEQIGGPGAQFVAHGLRLVALGFNGTVYEFSGTPNEWSEVASGVAAIALGDYLFGISEGNVLMMELDNAAAAPRGSAFPRWIWIFETADQAYAGYDGNVTLTLFKGIAHYSEVLPVNSFQRGKRYTLSMSFGLDDLESISLSGSRNFFEETWAVGKVIGWCVNTETLYEFRFDCDIPNGESVNRTPVSVLPHTASPRHATICIWSMRAWDGAVGYTSLMRRRYVHQLVAERAGSGEHSVRRAGLRRAGQRSADVRRRRLSGGGRAGRANRGGEPRRDGDQELVVRLPDERRPLESAAPELLDHRLRRAGGGKDRRDPPAVAVPGVRVDRDLDAREPGQPGLGAADAGDRGGRRGVVKQRRAAHLGPPSAMSMSL